jgi:hypothetical protein
VSFIDLDELRASILYADHTTPAIRYGILSFEPCERESYYLFGSQGP